MWTKASSYIMTCIILHIQCGFISATIHMVVYFSVQLSKGPTKCFHFIKISKVQITALLFIINPFNERQCALAKPADLSSYRGQAVATALIRWDRRRQYLPFQVKSKCMFLYNTSPISNFCIICILVTQVFFIRKTVVLLSSMFLNFSDQIYDNQYESSK